MILQAGTNLASMPSKAHPDTFSAGLRKAGPQIGASVLSDVKRAQIKAVYAQFV